MGVCLLKSYAKLNNLFLSGVFFDIQILIKLNVFKAIQNFHFNFK